MSTAFAFLLLAGNLLHLCPQPGERRFERNHFGHDLAQSLRELRIRCLVEGTLIRHSR
jgi:hypothetical protein